MDARQAVLLSPAGGEGGKEPVGEGREENYAQGTFGQAAGLARIGEPVGYAESDPGGAGDDRRNRMPQPSG